MKWYVTIGYSLNIFYFYKLLQEHSFPTEWLLFHLRPIFTSASSLCRSRQCRLHSIVSIYTYVLMSVSLYDYTTTLLGSRVSTFHSVEFFSSLLVWATTNNGDGNWVDPAGVGTVRCWTAHRWIVWGSRKCIRGNARLPSHAESVDLKQKYKMAIKVHKHTSN